MPPPYRRILVATDFSPPARLAAQRARQVAEAGAEFHLLHVLAHFPQDQPADWVVAEDADPRRRYLEQARERLRALDEATGLNATRRVLFSSRSARREIVAYAREIEADLVVLGAHGEAGVLQALFGSTAMGVVHDAPCDVLVVRPRP